jgi:hypothetical protein
LTTKLVAEVSQVVRVGAHRRHSIAPLRVPPSRARAVILLATEPILTLARTVLDTSTAVAPRELPKEAEA